MLLLVDQKTNMHRNNLCLFTQLSMLDKLQQQLPGMIDTSAKTFAKQTELASKTSNETNSH